MDHQLDKDKELVWIAAPFKELIRLSWPIATSMLSYSIMSITDTLFVGRLGSSALAGVGMASTVAFGLCCFPIGLLRAVKVLVSQAVGAKHPKSMLHAYLGAGLALATGLGLAVMFLGQWLTPVISELAATQKAGQLAAVYFNIRMSAVPFFMVYIAIREVRYGLSDAKGPMIASILANILNIALDAVFILILEWGVSGAAWATVIATAAELGFLALAHRKHGFGLLKWRIRHLVSIIRVGFPTGLQFVLEMGSFVILAVMISALCETEMAAHQIALQVIHFSFLPAFAVSEAVSVMTGQAVGANRDDLVRLVSNLGLRITLVYNGFCTIIFVATAHWITALFSSQIPVQTTATRLLYIAAIFQLADGANMVWRGALRGTGDVRIPALIGIVTAWAFTPPLTWLLGYLAGLGALGAWIGLCVEIFTGALLLRHRLVKGGWHSAAFRSRADLFDHQTACDRESISTDEYNPRSCQNG